MQLGVWSTAGEAVRAGTRGVQQPLGGGCLLSMWQSLQGTVSALCPVLSLCHQRGLRSPCRRAVEWGGGGGGEDGGTGRGERRSRAAGPGAPSLWPPWLWPGGGGVSRPLVTPAPPRSWLRGPPGPGQPGPGLCQLYGAAAADAEAADVQP